MDTWKPAVEIGRTRRERHPADPIRRPRPYGILLAGLAEPVGAQALQTQGLGRPYWHVFAAYAIAWALVLGWIVTIARRLARVEERLERR